ncbi:MAG: S23 ribosomal protein [Candidatus Magasanikbacteria bacterium GW2011_GWC2_34_16]|uniref:S23 ribosomal protein n=2 Tax=Candidatus Magasanikiibacteriota TaxID=1752731 RepID=A0A0G0HG10_9BACT|nr:MAG: S23 ribosomal protein [Candidatus Magasanikbacteria bacterium GW2011_GWC2_34_16]KKQ41112.1 MAG: S23 ribosomal protein [Candidatus Magasanikbacteria bacterium GW2011_GWA2_37_8]
MISENNPLYVKADKLANSIYEIIQCFPKYELYGLTSQLRRSALSVVLNIVEGFARQSKNEFRRFLIIAFGSLEETRYLINFSKKQNYLNELKFKETVLLINELAKIIWSIVNKK